MLISPKHASKLYDDIQLRNISNSSNLNLWLCDLAGDVVTSTRGLSETVKSVFEVPEFGNIIEPLSFDLLIFNGSLPQILANPKLKTLYETKWLNNDNFKDRALFLRLRMKLLLGKNLFIFEEDDEEYAKLKQCSLGVRPS